MARIYVFLLTLKIIISYNGTELLFYYLLTGLRSPYNDLQFRREEIYL